MQATRIIQWLYYLSIGLLLISLPFSNYTMSVSQFMLVGVFVLDGMKKSYYDDFRKKHSAAGIIVLFIPNAILWTADAIARKFRAFFHKENLSAWVFASIYLIHLIGLLYTTDFHYALKDLRIKFPLFLLPLLLSTTGVFDRRIFRYFVLLFIAAVFTGTLISTVIYLDGMYSDVRQISSFISHIRFSLLIDMAIFQAFYLAFRKSDNPSWLRLALAIGGIWMIAFLVIFGFLTGLVILVASTGLFLFIYAMMLKGIAFRAATISGIIVVMLAGGWYIYGIYRDVNKINPVDLKSLDLMTRQGNYYYNDTNSALLENGNRVWIYINEEEMREAWNRRSPLDYDGEDKAGQQIKHTLIRFLTSKGYRKDAEGVESLTEGEVAMIENGIASCIYVEKPMLYVRIYKIFWEYDQYSITHNASGHSLMQRFEYWRTAWAIANDNNSWLIGIGTGDLDSAFRNQYEKMGSKLEKEFRWRTHNQFLAIFVTFGIFGFGWFIFCLIFPAAHLRKFTDYYYLTFFLIFTLSMLTEDTLETQAGVTQFAFFTSFYLFSKKFLDIF